VNLYQHPTIRARRGAAVAILLALLFAGGATAFMSSQIVNARFERDISRIVYNDNLELLQDLRAHANAAEDSLLALLESPTDTEPPGAIIISITDNKLWYGERKGPGERTGWVALEIRDATRTVESSRQRGGSCVGPTRLALR
jgi:hypothetical protein